MSNTAGHRDGLIVLSLWVELGAVHQYDRFRDLLRRELGVDPSPALGELLPRRSFVDAGVTTHRR